MQALKPARGLGLTNFSFDATATPQLAKTLYALAWLGLLVVMMAMVLGGLYLMFAVGGLGFLAGVALIGAGPIVLLVGVMIVRVLLELVITLQHIEYNSRAQDRP
ncbi:DUF4282 domain-containing protein [Sinimarinibacterium sp. NLF-5-8]|uniref:DUF4282 domain-containing protein n=1 Tax=Sinimarinibacterium sp. NLF-5-8 TaxID=2698684 RepID=UPI00137BC7F9|nr:DUF4282 domain-containing protein [Sinimarinibacterium sp. NLF-5-8]QHS10853.1 DUF4282 domain-containing protein [Sinimarinibacterium sp. NLF-5-8]